LINAFAVNRLTHTLNFEINKLLFLIKD